MVSLRDAPIRQKLLFIILVPTAAALLLSGVGIMMLDSILFRAAMRRDVAALASIVGDNSTAALSFDDPRVASETLSALHARPHMVTACVYRLDGTVLARYLRHGAFDPCPAPGEQEALVFGRRGVVANHPIILENRRIGTVTMLFDTAEASARTKLYGGIVLMILLASSLLALAISTRLRNIVAGPVTRLAQAATSVSETADYSIRVPKDSADELGLLVESFNRMLTRVQSRDAEIQNARNLLETTLASIGDAVISTDIEGRIVFANSVARALLRWPGPDLAGKPIDEAFRIVNEFTRRKVESPIDRVLREGVIVGLANDSILIARDGTEIPIDDSAAPITQDGRTVGVVLVFRDIRERRREQQDAAWLAAIVESSEDAIIGKSPAGIIQSWNAGAERLYGFTAAEVVGHPMSELVPADRQHEESDILERMREGGRTVHFETVRVRKGGTLIDVALTISPIRDKTGQVVGISHIARDVTAQKRSAEQMRQTQKLESLGVLAGGIAHDFNNLLTGILGNASLAAEDLDPDSPARRRIEDAIAASERAAQLARQMLAYSGKGRFILEQIDLSARIRDTLPLIKAAIPPTVELRLNLDDRLPPIEADAAQVQQLVMNIIINGAEAVPEGNSGIVAISTRRQIVDEPYIQSHDGAGGDSLAPGPYVLFEVADTGAGMDEDTRSRIFDPFFTTKFTGRGLGLAAVLGIVRGHKGSIHVDSAPGRGSVFRVLFPALDSAPDRTPSGAQSQTADLRGSGLVLVIDDEQIVRAMARQALERYGYTVLAAENGAVGLEMFLRDAERVQCVVLDLTMPVMSGEETLNRLQAVRADVPVILSSGFNEAQAVRRFEGKGLAGFLQKPYRAAALVEKVQQVIAPTRPRAV